MVEKSEKQSVTKDQNWGGGTPGETVSYQGPKLGGGDSWPETVSYQGPKLGGGEGTPGQKQSVTKDQNWGREGTPGQKQ